MQVSMVTRGLVLLTLSAASLSAQRGGRPPRGGAPLPDVTPPPAAVKSADTSIVRKTPDGFVLDFQEQELRLVLSAIAEAGGLNVTLNNIPAKRITLRMGQAITKAGALDVLKGVAESNALKVTEGPSLIRIEGTPAPTNAQIAQQAQNQTQLRLYTYRLKHANAVQLGPVFMNLLTGAGNTGTTTILPNGIQLNQPGRAGGAGNAGNIQVNGRPGGPGQPFTIAAPNPGQQLAQQILSQFGGGNGAALQNAQNIRIVAEESTNSLLIRATAEDWILIQQLLATVDLRPLQVLIEVSIAQVSRTHDLNLGISGLQTKRNGVVADTQAYAQSAASARDFIFALTGGKGAVSYSVAFNALQTRGDVKVLSLPLVIAQNNKEAILNVGQSVPFVQTAQSSGLDPTGRTNTVQYLEVGTTLTITPTINPDGYVNLAVKQTNNAATNNLQFNAPIIDKREATTQIFIRDGQTTVIGGLSDNTSNNTTSGIPFLSRIPFIGGLLFGNTQKSAAVSELYLFLTPHIVSSDEDIDRLREAVRNGSEILQPTDVTSHITAAVDSIKALGKPETPRPAPQQRAPGTPTPIDTTRRRPPGGV